MLWTLFVVLLVLWLAGIITGFMMAGIIHFLLVLAAIALICELLTGNGELLRKLSSRLHSFKREA
jgi:hypothetical protein